MKIDKETGLKPCPMCGAPAKAWEWNLGARVDCSMWSCSEGQEHYVGVGGKTLEDAIAAWNRRYDSDEDDGK